MAKKTHYGTVDRANESDNYDYWSDTFCGLKEAEVRMSDNIKFVNCKRCLKSYEKQRDEINKL